MQRSENSLQLTNIALEPVGFSAGCCEKGKTLKTEFLSLTCMEALA